MNPTDIAARSLQQIERVIRQIDSDRPSLDDDRVGLDRLDQLRIEISRLERMMKSGDNSTGVQPEKDRP